MFGYVVLLAFVIMNVVYGEFTGNSLVTCTACQAVQTKDFSCNVNCQVANGNNELLQKLNQLTDRVEKLEAPRDAFTATSYKPDAQGTVEADVIVGSIYKFPTEVLDQLDSYDPTTGIFTPKQNGTYSLLLATRNKSSSQAILELFVEKPNNNTEFVCKASSAHTYQDSTCSTLYELQVGDKVYPKGSNENGQMNMVTKFGSFQAYFVY